ncbi:SDR family oxidoreductase [Lacrimispora sp. NSJ-141]|uniref:SDR family oxidoreductase n=1 Tax=Lientehia hominis TaxID=2897778 RepID=A0AAP2W739_9FIRM|nr:SDR family oxidoreductase [Lientehia hominis]MCD2491998.1 SDR family oxidoreductase [Lientehia hominis]
MDLHMKDKVAVVAGGSTGIGFAAAVCFLEEGCRVALFSRNTRKLMEAEAALEGMGYTDVMMESVDATDENAVNEFARCAAERFGTIDYWVNVAGGSLRKPLNKVTMEEFDGAVAVNFKSAFIGCNAAAQYMKRNERGGAIVNVSSMAAHRVAAGRTLYGCTKAALEKLTTAFAAELSPFHIRVNSVSPGLVLTELSRPVVPEEGTEDFQNFFTEYLIKRPGDAREVGAPIVLLCSDAFGFTTAADIRVDGGADAVYETRWIEENVELLRE